MRFERAARNGRFTAHRSVNRNALFGIACGNLYVFKDDIARALVVVARYAVINGVYFAARHCESRRFIFGLIVSYRAGIDKRARSARQSAVYRVDVAPQRRNGHGIKIAVTVAVRISRFCGQFTVYNVHRRIGREKRYYIFRTGIGIRRRSVYHRIFNNGGSRVFFYLYGFDVARSTRNQAFKRKFHVFHIERAAADDYSGLIDRFHVHLYVFERNGRFGGGPASAKGHYGSDIDGTVQCYVRERNTPAARDVPVESNVFHCNGTRRHVVIAVEHRIFRAVRAYELNVLSAQVRGGYALRARAYSNFEGIRRNVVFYRLKCVFQRTDGLAVHFGFGGGIILHCFYPEIERSRNGIHIPRKFYFDIFDFRRIVRLFGADRRPSLQNLSAAVQSNYVFARFHFERLQKFQLFLISRFQIGQIFHFYAARISDRKGKARSFALRHVFHFDRKRVAAFFRNDGYRTFARICSRKTVFTDRAFFRSRLRGVVRSPNVRYGKICLKLHIAARKRNVVVLSVGEERKRCADQQRQTAYDR